jgi:hypothetical protein
MSGRRLILLTVRGFGMLFDDRQPDGNKTEER